MRAVRIHAKRDMRTEKFPSPDPAADEVRVRVGYVGICGSDLHYYQDGAAGIFAIREPLIPGHEVSGVIDLDPAGAYEAGTPVTVHPATWGTPQPDLTDEQRHLWPGGGYLGSASTWPHTHGGLAEQLIVRRDQVRRLPASLPVKRAALAEPLAVGLHGLAVGGGIRGKRVLISGSGPIGLLTAAAAAAGGAAEVDLRRPAGRTAAARAVARRSQPGADRDGADRRREPAGLSFRRDAGVRRGAAGTPRAAARHPPGRCRRPGRQSARRDPTGQPGAPWSRRRSNCGAPSASTTRSTPQSRCST